MSPVSAVLHPTFWRTFWVNAVFSPKTTLGFTRIDFVLGTIFILPLTQMLFFAFVVTLAGSGADSVAFVVVGNAVATVTYASIFSVCQTTDHEKEGGTIEHLIVSPANRLALYFGRGTVPILISLASVTVGLTYAVLLFHAPLAAGAIPSLAVSVVLTCFAMVGFGLLLGGVALFLRTSIVLANIFLFIGLLISGTNFPVSELPPWLQVASAAFPLTWAIASVREAMAGAPIGTLAPLWGAVLLGAVVSLALAIALWGTFERRALSTGSIVRF